MRVLLLLLALAAVAHGQQTGVCSLVPKTKLDNNPIGYHDNTVDDGRLARRSSAEHLIATKALRCTATARMLIVARVLCAIP